MADDIHREVPSFFNETQIYVDAIIKSLGAYVSNDGPPDVAKYCVNALQKIKGDLYESAAFAYLRGGACGWYPQCSDGSLSISESKRFSFLRLRVFLKVIANWIFIVAGRFGRVFSGCDVIVRSWVEVSAAIYGKNHDYLYLVYPFGLKFRRQVAFIKQLRRDNLPYRVIGYQYSWKKLFKWLCTGKDVDLADLELTAFRRHAEYLWRRYHPSLVLTTDEFEPSSFILNKALMEKGVGVVNTAHGVGKYSPFVCYSEFRVFNDAQKDYYSKYSSGIKFVYLEEPPQPEVKPSPVSFVFVDQLLNNDGGVIERAQVRVFHVLARVAANRGVRFLIKKHPNSNSNHGAFERYAFKGNLEDIPNPVFFTFFSTAFVTFRIYGPTYLLEDDVFDPKLVFGSSNRVVNVEELDKFAESIIIEAENA